MGGTRYRSLQLYAWLIAILLAVVVFAPGPGRSRAMSAVHDFVHAPVFGIVCVAILSMLRQWPRQNESRVGWQYVLAIAATSAFGLATEIAQAFTGGDASWVDVRSDALGAMAAAGVFAAFDARIPRARGRVACALGAAAFVWHAIPLVATAADYARRAREFPVLMAADSVERNGFLIGSNAHLEQRPMPGLFAREQHEQALYVRFASGRWPGIHLLEPVPDWSGFDALRIDVVNPGDASLALMLRIHDRRHDQRFEDRFNRGWELPPNSRTILRVPLAEIEQAPKGRLLDLQQVAGVVLFTTDRYAGRELYVSRIWLEHDH